MTTQQRSDLTFKHNAGLGRPAGFAIRRRTRFGWSLSRASVHYVVGNSKFYDWVVPVQDILVDISRTAGLTDAEARVIRKRNSKKEFFEFVVSAYKKR